MYVFCIICVYILSMVLYIVVINGRVSLLVISVTATLEVLGFESQVEQKSVIGFFLWNSSVAARS